MTFPFARTCTRTWTYGSHMHIHACTRASPLAPRSRCRPTITCTMTITSPIAGGAPARTRGPTHALPPPSYHPPLPTRRCPLKQCGRLTRTRTRTPVHALAFSPPHPDVRVAPHLLRVDEPVAVRIDQ
eukprot:3275087-Pleurochrysis_carterae.AAC.3